MKKILMFIITLSIVSFSTYAQVEELKKGSSYVLDDEGNLVENNSPVFSFEKETHDFGEVVEGGKISHEFTFTNDGNEPLIIKSVKASCGCTTPNWPEEPIMPGEEATITATYNTKKRIGPFNKSITITSNAYTPTKRLFIKGKVLKPSEEETIPVKKPSIVNEADK